MIAQRYFDGEKMAELPQGMEFIQACPICNDAKVNREYIRTGLIYKICANCGTWYLSMRMTEERTIEYYRGEYRQNCKLDDLDLRVQRSRADLQYQKLSPYLAGKTMLEIGCSGEFLLRQFEDAGYTCVGIELDGVKPQRAQATIYPTLDALAPQPFDVICLSHSLEHFNHPKELVHRLVKNYSHPGTRILVEVPNASNSPCARIHHPFAWDSQALEYLMTACGCDPIKVILHGLGRDTPLYLLGLYEVRDAAQAGGKQ